MTDLTPAARAVLEAVTWKKYDVPPEGLPAFAEEMAPLIAAALRAAVDQVVPEREVPRGHFVDLGGGTVEVFPQSARGPIQRLRLLQEVRGQFLAIAGELETR